MTEARHSNFNRKVRVSQPGPGFVNTAPEKCYDLLDLRQAKERFGLNYWQIYAAAQRGELHPVKLGGKGRRRYPEWELEALAAILSCLYAA
jgi:hypothetical protein